MVALGSSRKLSFFRNKHKVIEQSTNYLVKIIVVKPQGKLSLQSHKYRSEHWIVVQGIATVTIDTFINIDIGLTDTTAGFFWHVRGENDAGNFSDWSNIWIFKITGPEGPGLHEPTTIDTIRTKPTFSWYNNQYLSTEYQLILGGTDPNPNEEGIYNGLGYFEEIIFVDTIPRSNDILQQYLPNQDILIELEIVPQLVNMPPNHL